MRVTSDRKEMVDCIVNGGVVIMPTDTIIGFHCRSDASDSIEKIRTIKGREENKPFLVLIESIDSLSELVNINKSAINYADKLWPGPFTFIFPAKTDFHPAVLSDSNTVAVRVPDCADIRAVSAEIGSPLISTSVNRSGQKSLTSFEEAIAEFGEEVDLVYIPDRYKESKWSASAIVDLTNWPPVCLREGPLALP